MSLSTDEIKGRLRSLDSRISSMQNEIGKLDRDRKVTEVQLKDNQAKIKLHKQLPYLVSNVVEVRAV